MIVRFVASNGVEISGGSSLFIKDNRARSSEGRMITILQHRKTQALREYFEQDRIDE